MPICPNVEEKLLEPRMSHVRENSNTRIEHTRHEIAREVVKGLPHVGIVDGARCTARTIAMIAGDDEDAGSKTQGAP